MRADSANFGSSSQNSQEVELNITSIIDCFTVLITFLLASASFLSIGFFDAATAGPSNEVDSKDVPPPIEITVVLKKDASYVLKVSGRVTKEQKFDQESLAKELGTLKSSFPTVNTVALLTENEVPYKSIIESMDKIRKQMPNILLGEL